MSSDQVLTLIVTLLVLVTITVLVGRWAGLGQGRAVALATARAVVQLMLVGAVIGAILRTPALAPVYLIVTLVAAASTSSGRLGRTRHTWAAAAGAILAGASVSALVVFGCGALAWDARTLVPFVMQLIGGAMTATTLAGQRLIDDVGAQWAEVEGWLALGATPRQAVADLARRAAGRALVPALDQTRNVGLVVLPGAFVGMLLGGAGPLQAGRVQVLVLVGLLAAETVSAVTITRLLSRPLGGRRPIEEPQRDS